MHSEIYVVKEAVGSCVEHWLLREKAKGVQVTVIHPEDERANLAKTHVKISIDRGSD